MFCLSNVHVLPVKRARLERKTTRKKVCAERLLANGNNEVNYQISEKRLRQASYINFQVIRTATILTQQKIVQMLLTMFPKPRAGFTGFKQKKDLLKYVE